jgi:glycosyltransferase involved in cell wall biosynthesis
LAETALVIPAYNPDATLLCVTKGLLNCGFRNIFVVDDGSDTRYDDIFAKVAAFGDVVLIRHQSNRGTGAALKTGFQHVIETLPASGIRRIVTVDGDGQHSTEDVLKVACQCGESPEDFVLGVRDFSGAVPFRSKLGNWFTKLILRITKGVRLRDTQTGLRGVPIDLANDALKIPSNRYEFELECILLAKQLDIGLTQVSIKTIYIEKNKSSHFRPIIDSTRVYLVFFRFGLVSAMSFGIDIGAFVAFNHITSDVIVSTYLARVLSSSFNFAVNKYAVFSSTDHKLIAKESVAYICLAIVIATLSAYGVRWSSGNWDYNIVAIKIVVDLILFALSFLIQRLVIFKAKGYKTTL